MNKCPYCAEEIHEETIKCDHCGEMLTVAAPTSTAPQTERLNTASPSEQQARSPSQIPDQDIGDFIRQRQLDDLSRLQSAPVSREPIFMKRVEPWGKSWDFTSFGRKIVVFAPMLIIIGIIITGAGLFVDTNEIKVDTGETQFADADAALAWAHNQMLANSSLGVIVASGEKFKKVDRRPVYETHAVKKSEGDKAGEIVIGLALTAGGIVWLIALLKKRLRVGTVSTSGDSGELKQGSKVEGLDEEATKAIARFNAFGEKAQR